MPNTFTLHELLIQELQDLHSAETLMIEALPKMSKAAASHELKASFDDHLRETQTHLTRLNRVMELLGGKSNGKTCKAMEGLIAEANDRMELDADPAVIDAALISAAQKVEHYEIAGYGSVRTYAEMLGEDEVAELLQQTLDEESEADDRLTDIAEINSEEVEQIEDAER